MPIEPRYTAYSGRGRLIRTLILCISILAGTAAVAAVAWYGFLSRKASPAAEQVASPAGESEAADQDKLNILRSVPENPDAARLTEEDKQRILGSVPENPTPMNPEDKMRTLDSLEGR